MRREAHGDDSGFNAKALVYDVDGIAAGARCIAG